MRLDILLAVAVVVLGALGTYLLLPHRHGSAKPRSAHAAGAVLVGLSFAMLAFFWTPPDELLAGLFFYAFAFMALAAGVLMITSRNPVHSALWFAAVVLSTSGLFLLEGAQFLAAGTIIVYAGAIIVTFLFVIMLAQAEGQALYDRSARTPARATVSCFLLFWGVLYALVMVKTPEGPRLSADEAAHRLTRNGALADHLQMPAKAHVRETIDSAIRPETARIAAGTPHVAGLGGTLYTDHLIAVEAAGAILFVALVGAIAIATPRPPIRPVPGRAA